MAETIRAVLKAVAELDLEQANYHTEDDLWDREMASGTNWLIALRQRLDPTLLLW